MIKRRSEEKEPSEIKRKERSNNLEYSREASSREESVLLAAS
jgi:hypothetical protein